MVRRFVALAVLAVTLSAAAAEAQVTREVTYNAHTKSRICSCSGKMISVVNRNLALRRTTACAL